LSGGAQCPGEAANGTGVQVNPKQILYRATRSTSL